MFFRIEVSARIRGFVIIMLNFKGFIGSLKGSAELLAAAEVLGSHQGLTTRLPGTVLH